MANLAAGRAARGAFSGGSSGGSGSGRDGDGGGGGRRSPAPWQVSEEDWKKLPQEQRDALQEKRDQFLAEQKIKNDPLSVAKEKLQDAMNPGAPADNSPNARLKVADETIQDYQAITKLLLSAVDKDQIPGATVGNSMDYGLRANLYELTHKGNEEVFTALGVTRDQFFKPLEDAYAVKGEAYLTKAVEIPADVKTPREAYDQRHAAYNNAGNSFDMLGMIKSIHAGEGFMGADTHRQIALNEHGLSEDHLNDVGTQIRTDLQNQIRQQANLEGQREDAQVGYLSPEARNVPRFEP